MSQDGCVLAPWRGSRVCSERLWMIDAAFKGGVVVHARNSDRECWIRKHDVYS